MFSSVLVRITQKLHLASLNKIYRNIVKLEWFAIVSLVAWLLIVFSIILV
jgi:hypothetical protein